MIYQIFIYIRHRFQPIICLTRGLTTLEAMLLRPNKDYRAGGGGVFSADSAQLQKGGQMSVRLEAAPDAGQGA